MSTLCKLRTMEHVADMMMHMAQSLQMRPHQQLIQQQNQQVQHEERRSSYVNEGTHQRRGESPQGSTSTSTKRTKAKVGND